MKPNIRYRFAGLLTVLFLLFSTVAHAKFVWEKPPVSPGGIGYELASSIHIGNISTNVSFYDSRNTGDYNSPYGAKGKDICYTFTTVQPLTTVILDNYGGEMMNSNFTLMMVNPYGSGVIDMQPEWSDDIINNHKDQLPDYYSEDIYCGSLAFVLEPGTYYLVHEGPYGNAGAYIGVVVTNFYAFTEGPHYGRSTDNPIQITSECSSLYYTDVQPAEIFWPTYGDQTLPDVSYMVEATKTSRLEISRPYEVSCESVYYLLDKYMNSIAESDETNRLIYDRLPPGTYYIINKALFPEGRIGLNVDLYWDMEAPGYSAAVPIDLGAFNKSFRYENSYQSKHYITDYCSRDYGPSEVYYKVNLQKNMSLKCTMKGLEYQEITILNSTGTTVAYTQGSGGSASKTITLDRDLQHGEYILKFETDGWDHPVEIAIEGVYTMTGPARGFLTLDQSENYILTTSPVVATKNVSTLQKHEARFKVDYTDRLGRVKQSIDIWKTNGDNDIVQSVFYDYAGRKDSVAYLPYASPDNAGLFRSAFVSEQSGFYRTKFGSDPDADHTMAAKQYDAVGQPVLETAAGVSGTQHPMRHEYRLNTAGEVRRYRVTDPNGVVYSDYYAAGTLQVHVSWREDLPAEETVTNYEYIDAEGQKIAVRTRTASADEFTYSVYDDFNNLRYTIPAIIGDTLVVNTIYRPEELSLYSFYYEYDQYGHQIKAFIPGAEPLYQLYDKRGRIVMKQTGRQRADGKNEWTFFKYDGADRQVLTGTYSGGTFEEHSAALRTQIVFGETRGTATHGYTNLCYPILASTADVLTATYYDDYDWLPTGSECRFSLSDRLGVAYSSAVLGHPTGSKNKVLGIDEDRWLTTATYYDDQYRTIQSVTELYPGGVEVVSNDHDHVGNVVRTKVRQTVGSQTYEYNKYLDYDLFGRLLTVRQDIVGDTNNGEVTVATFTYDDLGQTTRKRIHGGAETTDFAYRLTGAQSHVISPSFSYWLGFDRPVAGQMARNDGKLADMAWGRGTAMTHGYRFAYDPKGQLTDASHAVRSAGAWAATTAYNEDGIAYDANGNIMSLHRSNAEGNTLHDLIYSYNGNQLLSVSDNGTESGAYAYDGDGNMTFDGLRGVGIEYNELNLPARIFAGSDEIRYIYSSAGTKLASVANGSSFTYYRSVMVYGQSTAGAAEQMLYILQPEGLVARGGNGDWTYKYFKKDHLSNTRVVLAATQTPSGVELVPEQTTDYYAYGLAWEYENLHQNRYLYNGKELQDASVGNLGLLGLYDFGARYYDPMLGRWFNIDPALQLLNPYLFCGNSPMVYVDKNGKFFLSFLFGFFEGLFTGKNPFKTGWHDVKMTAKLIGGLFTGNFFQILSRLTWELPQTLLGLGTNIGANWFKTVDEVDYAYGATVTRVSGERWGAFTLGSYILGDMTIKADPSNSLFQHEYGHYLQSQAWGPFYMGKVAIPSLISAVKHDSQGHNAYKTEQDANVRALKFWEKKFPGFYQGGVSGWNQTKNDITDFKWEQPFDSAVNQQAMRDAKMSGIGWADFIQVVLPRPIGLITTGVINY